MDNLRVLSENYAQAIRRRQTNGPYTLLGRSYGAFLAPEAARLRHADGEGVALVLLDPVCRADFRYNGRAALLHLLAQERVSVSLPDDLERLPPDAHVSGFMRNATAVGLLASEPDLPQAQAWLERIAHLLDLLLGHTRPTPLPIPCLWLSAAHRPAHWHAAEHDRRDWAAGAERHTLDSDHWQLMLDDVQAQHTAALFRQWRKNLLPRENA